MKIALVAGSLCALIAAGVSMDCLAQSLPAPGKLRQSLCTKSSYQRNERQFSTTSVTRTFDLPYVPALPGARYLSGFVATNEKPGLSAQQHFSAMQDTSAIVDWYNHALRNSGWTLQPVHGLKDRISAFRTDGHFCQIIVSPANTDAARTHVRVVYHASQ